MFSRWWHRYFALFDPVIFLAKNISFANWGSSDYGALEPGLLYLAGTAYLTKLLTTKN